MSIADTGTVTLQWFS